MILSLTSNYKSTLIWSSTSNPSLYLNIFLQSAYISWEEAIWQYIKVETDSGITNFWMVNPRGTWWFQQLQRHKVLVETRLSWKCECFGGNVRFIYTNKNTTGYVRSFHQTREDKVNVLEECERKKEERWLDPYFVNVLISPFLSTMKRRMSQCVKVLHELFELVEKNIKKKLVAKNK